MNNCPMRRKVMFEVAMNPVKEQSAWRPSFLMAFFYGRSFPSMVALDWVTSTSPKAQLGTPPFLSSPKRIFPTRFDSSGRVVSPVRRGTVRGFLLHDRGLLGHRHCHAHRRRRGFWVSLGWAVKVCFLGGCD